jgi:hypothetical protein
MKNITLVGVMGMASLSDDTAMITGEFRKLKMVFNHLKNKFFTNAPEFCEISMGMTGDYNIAIKEGSTIVRIGTGIFGKMNV